MDFYYYFDAALPYIIIFFILTAIFLTIQLFLLLRPCDDNSETKEKIIKLAGEVAKFRDKWFAAEERCSVLEHKLVTYKTAAKTRIRVKGKKKNDPIRN